MPVTRLGGGLDHTHSQRSHIFSFEHKKANVNSHQTFPSGIKVVYDVQQYITSFSSSTSTTTKTKTNIRRDTKRKIELEMMAVKDHYNNFVPHKIAASLSKIILTICWVEGFTFFALCKNSNSKFCCHWKFTYVLTNRNEVHSKSMRNAKQLN